MESCKNIQEDHFAKSCSSIISGVISVFLLVLVTVFPMIYHNSYFDILETKYQCYYGSLLVMLAVVLVLGLVMLGVDLKEFKGSHAKTLFGKLKPVSWKDFRMWQLFCSGLPRLFLHFSQIIFMNLSGGTKAVIVVFS